MSTFLVIVHVLVCFAVVFVVLLQAGKGADIGAAFGGGSQTLFGSRGAAPFLTKVTAVAGAIFMFTSLGLALISSHSTGASIIKETPAQGMPKGMPQGMPGTPFGKPAPSPAGSPAPAKPAFPAQGGK